MILGSKSAESFLEHLHSTLASILVYPQTGARRFSLRKPRLRMLPIPHFNHYLIYYSPYPHKIVLHTIVHSSRDQSASLDRA